MNRRILGFLFVLVMASFLIAADQEKPFSGLNLDLGSLARLSKAQTRSISPENFTGEKGKAGMSVD